MVSIGFAHFFCHGLMSHFNNFRNGVGYTGNPALIQTGLNPGSIHFCDDGSAVGNFSSLALSTAHAAQTGGNKQPASQVAVFRNPQFHTASVQNGVEGTMDNPLGSNVHPAASGHLPIVGNAHFFCDFPILQVIVFTNHQAVGDDNPGSFRFGMEQAHRVAGFHNQGLVFGHFFQVPFDQVVLRPVMADAAGFPVGNQFVRIQGYFKVQVVVDHDLEGFASGAFAFVFVDGFAVNPAFRTETIAVNPAPGSQFFQKFRNQFIMIFFRNVAQGILQSDFRLGRSQPEAPVRSSADAFLERFLRRQPVREFQFNRHCLGNIFILH